MNRRAAFTRSRSRAFIPADGASSFEVASPQPHTVRDGSGKVTKSIGDVSDVQRLRDYAKRQRKLPGAASLGRQLARKLAEPVRSRIKTCLSPCRSTSCPWIDDLTEGLGAPLLSPDKTGHVQHARSSLRCAMAGADPVDALNSLNQTVYFLRRVLEEPYVDDWPGYLHHNSDLIWLDSELVSSRSNRCRKLIKDSRLRPARPGEELVEAYVGRFALDFEYEEWASLPRWLHASYLEIVERAINDDIETGQFDRGINLARRVLDVDPTAERVELSLLRLYRASGAHAAAAEQYSHYASAIREQLGVEPPPLESL